MEIGEILTGAIGEFWSEEPGGLPFYDGCMLLIKLWN